MTNPELCLEWKDQGANATTPAPQLCVLLLTYVRTTMACRTISGLAENLDYPKELVSFYVADDGSPSAHMVFIEREIAAGGFQLAGYHSQKYAPAPFCGIGWNQGLHKAHQNSDFVMILEDDWVLEKPMDIRPFMWMLSERKDVGMLRLSGLAAGNIVKVVAHRGVHYLEYLRIAPMCYSGNPHIRHLRFSECYGNFAIDQSPGDIEVWYDAKFHRMSGGPNIWRPANLNPWGPFAHIGCERTW